MSRFFSVFVILAILAGGGWWVYHQKAEQEAQAAIASRLREARRAFAERARAAITEDETEDYLSGVKAALKAYEDELKNTVYADRPDDFDVDAQKKRLNEALREGNLTEAQHKGLMERFALVKDAYETLMARRWQPDLTQAGKDETRLDIYDVKRVRDPDGNPLIEAKFFLWGIEPNTRLSFGDLALEYWKEEEPDRKTRRKRRRQGLDPNAPMLKPLGRAEGSARPKLIDQEPAETIAEFPSYVAVGTLVFPQVPREAKVMDLRYGYMTRKGGSEVETKLVWDKMPIPPKWMLGEGETWMAEEVEATEDELAGVDPLAPDAGVKASE